jgi:hypothetical protein
MVLQGRKLYVFAAKLGQWSEGAPIKIATPPK